ncbi:hypothetical protein E2C01_003731 [Portunus trituberculatus]|uniref:Uncharacterized protein n=1 Tax=Portunus trituberculatus TaxID=210409 RepID=A0A5B7CPJ0_PORTR|nr:hypothetical protein [Portunus trituberculatus]
MRTPAARGTQVRHKTMLQCAARRWLRGDHWETWSPALNYVNDVKEQYPIRTPLGSGCVVIGGGGARMCML